MNDNNTQNTTQRSNTPPEGNGNAGKMFTQEEVNTIVQERLARERSKHTENADDLSARENELKVREEALASKSKEYEAWKSREACKKYLEENHIIGRLIDSVDTSDVEEFKKTVQAMQKATNNSFTYTTTTKGVKVENPPVDHSGYTNEALHRAFGLN